jgi:hypothetical protein
VSWRPGYKSGYVRIAHPQLPSPIPHRPQATGAGPWLSVTRAGCSGSQTASVASRAAPSAVVTAALRLGLRSRLGVCGLYSAALLVHRRTVGMYLRAPIELEPVTRRLTVSLNRSSPSFGSYPIFRRDSKTFQL